MLPLARPNMAGVGGCTCTRSKACPRHCFVEVSNTRPPDHLFLAFFGRFSNNFPPCFLFQMHHVAPVSFLPRLVRRFTPSGDTRLGHAGSVFPEKISTPCQPVLGSSRHGVALLSHTSASHTFGTWHPPASASIRGRGAAPRVVGYSARRYPAGGASVGYRLGLTSPRRECPSPRSLQAAGLGSFPVTLPGVGRKCRTAGPLREQHEKKNTICVNTQ